MGKLRVFDSSEVTFHYRVGLANSHFALNNTAEDRKINTPVQRPSPGPVKSWFFFAKSL
jgi:hypothetical protein